MMSRLQSRILVQALIRRVQQEAGFATVIYRGDDVAGTIMVQLAQDENGETPLFERIPDIDGGYRLEPVSTQYWGDFVKIIQYIDRRRDSDPDLWLVELDVANAQQLAVEILQSS